MGLYERQEDQKKNKRLKIKTGLISIQYSSIKKLPITGEKITQFFTPELY